MHGDRWFLFDSRKPYLILKLKAGRIRHFFFLIWGDMHFKYSAEN